MKVTSSDFGCRYISALGTSTDRFTPFGRFLADNGVEFKDGISLRFLIEHGWLTPSLRVILPRVAFDSWRDYPLASAEGVEECPEADQWAVSLLLRGDTSPRSRADDRWWLHFLDDLDDPVTAAARAHAVNVAQPHNLPPPFQHARHNQTIAPWMDYFAYWHAFVIAELLNALIVRAGASLSTETVTRSWPMWQDWAYAKASSVANKWKSRSVAFDWISRMRAALAASTYPQRDGSELSVALQAIVDAQGITVDQMAGDIRSTLLTIWREWADWPGQLGAKYPKLLGLLRQEIEYGIIFTEWLTNQPTDFLSPRWYYSSQTERWARLIDALPREEELARREFASTAMMYLKDYAAAVAPHVQIDRASLKRILNEQWFTNRSLRRFVLAIYRLHRELGGENLTESEDVIRQAECIEQFNLAMMHAERVLSREHRKLPGVSNYPEVRKLARGTMDRLLRRWGIPSATIAAVMAQTDTFLKAHAQLHDLKDDRGLPLVNPTLANSGSAVTDHIMAAFINFVIGRNYAAHHDVLDHLLIYPAGGGQGDHPGGRLLSSVLAAVVTVLLGQPPADPQISP